MDCILDYFRDVVSGGDGRQDATGRDHPGGADALAPVRLSGAALALALVSLIGVAVGTALGRYLPEDLLKKLAASAFIIAGVLMFWGKM